MSGPCKAKNSFLFYQALAWVKAELLEIITATVMVLWLWLIMQRIDVIMGNITPVVLAHPPLAAHMGEKRHLPSPEMSSGPGGETLAKVGLERCKFEAYQEQISFQLARGWVCPQNKNLLWSSSSLSASWTKWWGWRQSGPHRGHNGHASTPRQVRELSINPSICSTLPDKVGADGASKG